MHYRFIDKKRGATFTVSTAEPAEAQALEAKFVLQVADVFTQLGAPLISLEGLRPEVLTDETVSRIERLEDALQNCLDMMSEHDMAGEPWKEWDEALAEADRLLGL
jgi:hypothetical protein